MISINKVIGLEINDKERVKYGEYLTNWIILNNYISKHSLSERDLIILFKLELEGNRRKHIISRLKSRLFSFMSRKWESELAIDYDIDIRGL